MILTESPSATSPNTVRQLRECSRKLVRELGFMRNTLADSDLAPSAVHAILEIGGAPGISAKDLGVLLRLDKSNTSRQVARLESDGLVERRVSADDARSSELFLTAAGKQLRQKIDRFASSQVASALQHLPDADQLELVRTLGLYADALGQDNVVGSAPGEGMGPSISEGYQPGCIGDVVGLHARFYAEHWGFGAFFEKRVATELAAFADALPADGKALWLCVEDGRTLASLAIDGDLETGTAHLRWFIVDDTLRGTGIGRQLMARAMEFVDRHFVETYLATFKGLDAARHLYESFGFELCEETEGTQWGTKVLEQRFVRRAG
ncbi:helix-turn-helix domain-containing GNAT family N-acetyltransferase [Paraburkholderia sp. DHOC27]|uniref:bifunctional helix-turn-helix transcriptional regulator/GNAT family N-acetyltransferase n=1 Tax=Paraburkholderia sp. DHOC27 TaxID=2303330 RepID=UPI000E3ECC41|nr:helix-turn-helix domain-containing GNAT family N-acetyltransferase [Paraburkholderia sp. DHOC27]RFU44894.1 MarR family transcriptional regulator [Paraburkholderia sp. DHOC27]